MTDIDPERLLRGGYEIDRLSEEPAPERPAPHAETHPLQKSGRLREPVLDQEGRTNDVRWPDDSEFAVCLTHDVDHVSAHSPRQHIRRGLLRAVERLRNDDPEAVPRSGASEAIKGIAGGTIRSARAATARGPDPYHRWEDWLELERSVGARSTFFVLPERTGTRHVTDAEYRYDDPIVFEGRRRPLSEVLHTVSDRGWEIGLHGAWYSYDDAEEMRSQREQVEAVVDEPVQSVRQHWLHHDVRTTPIAQEKAGLRYDSTLGPKGGVGFRFGTSRPWRLRDPTDGSPLDLIEIPLVVQDTALFDEKYLGLSEDEGVQLVLDLADRVAAVGGVLTLNWHNVADGTRWSAYQRILRQLSGRGAWFGTVEEVGDWWYEQKS